MRKTNVKKVIVMTIFSLIISSVKVIPVNAASSNMQSFENGVPSNWTSEKGTLETSTRRYKDKDHSLLWNWESNDKLTVDAEKNLLEAGKNRHGGIILWLYNENPRNDTLTFNFGTKEQINNNNPLYTFDVYLNFNGWRTVWVDFKDDATNKAFVGKREGNLEQMQIVAPQTEGSIYFDVLEFRNSMYWNRMQDYQVPIQRSKDEKGDVWQRNYYHINKKPYLPLEPITNEHIESFKTIENRVNDWIYGGSKYTNAKEMVTRKRSLDKFIKQGIEKYDSFNIERHPDGRITGKPLFGNRSPYVTNQNGFGSGLADTVFLPLVYDYKLNGNEESLQKLYDLYDYYHDQGWAEGSGLGSWNLGILRTTGYFISVYLMKDELKQTNRLDREMRAFNWFSDFGKVFIDPEKEKESSNSDDLRTNSFNRLLYILMMEDSPEKVQAMKSYINWFNNTLKVGNYLSGTIKPDYMGFHHQAPYMSAYSTESYHLTSAIVYLLHDTIFKVSDEIHNNLKKALITHDILTNQIEIPISLRGRIVASSPISIKLLPAYAYLAMAGNPDTNEDIDTEMAGIFMKNWKLDDSILQRDLIKQSGVGISYVNTLGAISVMLDVVNSGVSASPEQQGFWSKPYGGLAVKRKDNWMAMVKGWSKYLWDYESSGTENIYGRYLSYGTLQLMSKGPLITDKNNGYDFENGWDWNRMPGATTKHLSLHDLSSKNNNDEHRTYSDQTFLGSVEGKNDNGVWAMSMHDLTFDNSFYAKKSVFFLGDEMILLGSDIKNKDTQNKTETTLFQSSIYDNTNKPIHIGSAGEITQFPYKNKLDKGANWLIDPYDNGYYIPDASNIHITRERQTSRNNSDKADTYGNYATAWIDHGNAPNNGEYEYAIKVQTTPEEMANYASNVNYEVAQKDSTAHIVKSKDTGVIGYAIFEENQKLSNQDYIVETDTPILAMVTPTGDDISLSISDPDLRVSTSDYMSPSTMKKTRVTLKGKWSLKNKSDNITILSSNENNTVIEVNCIDGKTVDVELQKQNSMYNVNVTNGLGTGSYKEGDTVTIEANEENDNKKFVEWTSPDGVQFNDPTQKVTSFIMPNKDVTINANYVNYYTITATSNEGGKITPGTVKIQEGTSQRYQIIPDEGYEIDDVLVNGNSIGNVSEYTFENITSDGTIQVYFNKKAEIPKYTVKFDSNGGSNVSDIVDVKENSTISKPKDPTREGFVFEGWYKDEDLKTPWDFKTDKITSNITLYAKWIEIPKYIVKFDSNGGSNVSDIVDVKENSTISKPEDPIKEGFMFEGWYKDSSYTNVWDFETDKVTSNITLYAKWREIPKYTVKFDSNGGSNVSDIVDVKENSTISKPKDPTREGFVFEGWYKDEDLKTPWDFTIDKVTSNITLYAKWNLKMFAINSKPVINVENKILKVGDNFDPINIVTAIDNEDGDITKYIKVIENTVNTSKSGIYKVVYEVQDSKGAKTTKAITVTVMKENIQENTTIGGNKPSNNTNSNSEKPINKPNDVNQTNQQVSSNSEKPVNKPSNINQTNQEVSSNNEKPVNKPSYVNQTNQEVSNNSEKPINKPINKPSDINETGQEVSSNSEKTQTGYEVILGFAALGVGSSVGLFINKRSKRK